MITRLLLLEGVLLASFSAVRVFPSWSVMLLLWFAAVAIQDGQGWVRTMTASPRWLHWFGAAAFPLGSTAWKWWQGAHALGDGGPANRLQHLVWSAATVALALPMLVRWWRNRGFVEQVVVAVGLVALIGNLIEMIEYLGARHRVTREPSYGAFLFRDTILDLAMNVIGAATAASVAIAVVSAAASRRPAVAGDRRSDPAIEPIQIDQFDVGPPLYDGSQRRVGAVGREKDDAASSTPIRR